MQGKVENNQARPFIRLWLWIALGVLGAVGSIFIWAAYDDAPDIGLVVVNKTNFVQIKTDPFENVSRGFEVEGHFTGDLADVIQQSTIKSGEAILTILDTFGNEIYRGHLATPGLLTATKAKPGARTIKVALTHCSGTIDAIIEQPGWRTRQTR